MKPLNYKQFKITGDKENSQFFMDTLPRLYERREKSGVFDNIDRIRAIVVQVGHGNAIFYLQELYLMTPYRFVKAYRTASHTVYILTVKPEFPAYIILEPLTDEYFDELSALNYPYQKAKPKLQTRYIGEIFRVHDKKELEKIFVEQDVVLRNADSFQNTFMGNKNFLWTDFSLYSHNFMGYTENECIDFDELEIGEEISLTVHQQKLLDASIKIQKAFGFDRLIRGLDHIATRALNGMRENALLELVTITNYYFWGGYNLEDQDSSTNICRNPKITDELTSPAKVFTVCNAPMFVKSMTHTSPPVVDKFVRNFGLRMHHLAYEVIDGAQEDGQKNIDYVVNQLINADVPFLMQIIGECKDVPDLKQIFSRTSQMSLLITEYVQRCHGFAGFFTKTNVQALTAASSIEQGLMKPEEFKGKSIFFKLPHDKNTR